MIKFSPEGIFDQKGSEFVVSNPNFELSIYTTIYRTNEIRMPGTQGKRELDISGA